MRTYYFWWRDIYDMYKKERKGKEKDTNPGDTITKARFIA